MVQAFKYTAVTRTSFLLTRYIKSCKIVHKILNVNALIGAGCFDDLSQNIIRDLLFISDGFESLKDTVLADLANCTYSFSIAFCHIGMHKLCMYNVFKKRLFSSHDIIIICLPSLPIKANYRIVMGYM